MNSTKAVFHGWKVVATCFVIAGFAWTLGLFGTSVYLRAVTAAHGWAVAQVSSAITAMFVVSALMQGAVGRAIERFGARPVLSAGTVAITTGVASIGQVTAPWQLYPAFVAVGIGWSMISTTGITATVAPWFERHQGRSMTLAMMGASMGAIAGVPLMLAAVLRLGLTRGLATVAAGAALALLPLIAIGLRHRGPAALGLRRDGDAPSAGAPARAAAPVAHVGNQARLLWSAAIAFALGLMVQVAFVTHHVVLAASLVGPAGAGLLVSATGACALAGRLVLARFVDRVNVRRLAALVMGVQAAVLLALALWPGVAVLIGASLVYGFGIGYVTTLAPVVVRREFGADSFGRTYGRAAVVIQLTSASGPAFLGVLRDAFGGYGPGLVVSALLAAIGAAVLLMGARAGGAASPDALRDSGTT